MSTHTHPLIMDFRRLKNILEKVIDSHHADLSDVVSGSLDDFANRMFQANIISNTVKDHPDFNKIMKDYKAQMLFLKQLADFRNHCLHLILILQNIGGPASTAAEQLEREWTKGVFDEMGIEFMIVMKPQQAQQTKVNQQNPPSRNYSIPGSLHKRPPYICHHHNMPTSSSVIWQRMQHNHTFRQQILEAVSENVMTNKGQSSETLSMMWQQQAQQQRQQFPSSAAIDEYMYMYSEGSQTSGDMTAGVWGVPNTSPDQSLNNAIIRGTVPQRVPVLSDPSFIQRSQSSDHSVPNIDPIHSEYVPPSEVPLNPLFRPLYNTSVMVNDATPLYTDSSRPLSMKHPELLSEGITDQEDNELVTVPNDLNQNTVLSHGRGTSLRREVHSPETQTKKLGEYLDGCSEEERKEVEGGGRRGRGRGSENIGNVEDGNIYTKLHNENQRLKRRLSEMENERFSRSNSFQSRLTISEEIKHKDINIATLQAQVNALQGHLNEHRIAFLLLFAVFLIIFFIQAAFPRITNVYPSCNCDK